jgi:hypothetical protein
MRTGLACARAESAADVDGRGPGGSSAWLALPAAMSATVATTRHRSGVRVDMRRVDRKLRITLH